MDFGSFIYYLNVCLCFRPIVFVVKNAPTFESNFVFATLMPLANGQLNTSQQSNENARHTSWVEKGTASKNCDTANTPCKRKQSPTHAKKNSIHTPVAGILFLIVLKYLFCITTFSVNHTTHLGCVLLVLC
jgi:hypothetical protein